MKLARLTPLSFVALLLSLLFHVLLVLGEPVAQLLAASHHPVEQTPVLFPPVHHLQAQVIAPSVNHQHTLPGIRPVDIITISLNHAPRLIASAAAPSLSPAPAPVQPVKHAKPRIKKPKPTLAAAQPESLQTAAVANKPAETNTSTSAEQPADAPIAAASPAATEPVADKADTTPNKALASNVPTSAPASDTSPQATPATPAADPSSKVATEASKPAPPAQDNTFPANVDISYAFKAVITAKHRWRLKDSHYEIDTKASLLGFGIEFHSEGDVDEHGLRPTRYTEFRNNGSTPYSTVDFDWDAGAARFGDHAFKKDTKLSAGAEDVFSAAYQFALQGDKLPNFNLQVFTGRKDYQIPFELRGETQLSLSGKKVPVLLLAGSKEDQRYEFYLAPEWHNLPVRMRMIDNEKGSDYDLVATRITIDGKTVLQPPPMHEVN